MLTEISTISKISRELRISALLVPLCKLKRLEKRDDQGTSDQLQTPQCLLMPTAEEREREREKYSCGTSALVNDEERKEKERRKQEERSSSSSGCPARAVRRTANM